MKNILRKIVSVKWWYRFVHTHKIRSLIWLLNSRVREQKKNPKQIPVVIINYNRLKDLKNLVDSLLSYGHKNIIIVDNKSTYPPLLEYYKHIADKIYVEYMEKNEGHMAFWNNSDLFQKYASGYYIVTDSDIELNKNLPSDYLKTLLHILDSNKKITKVGFALEISDIPDSFAAKNEVLQWEKKYWNNPIGDNLYLADIDTTFALYAPYELGMRNFYKAIRVAGNFTARHMGWYIDSQNLSDEDKFYFSSANKSNSWKLDENGKYLKDE